LKAFPATRLWLFLLLTLTLIPTGSGNENDATGREVSFYPIAMMLAANLKALVIFLVSERAFEFTARSEKRFTSNKFNL